MSPQNQHPNPPPNQTVQLQPAVATFSDIPKDNDSSNINKIFIVIIIILIILIALGSFFLLSKSNFNLQISKQDIITPEEPTPITNLSPAPPTEFIQTPTANITSDWKTVTSPLESQYPFQISYPATWITKTEQDIDAPSNFLLILTNSNNETIEVSQGTGGGGSCVFYDDENYANFQGMGTLFTYYIQLEKPAIWRIGGSKESAEYVYTVCEKSKTGYLDGTRIGWITIKLKSDTSLSEVKSILESIFIKPMSEPNPIFD